MSDSEEEEDINKDDDKGWVKVEEYHPENVRITVPDKNIKVLKNDKAILEIREVTLEDGTVVTDQKEDMRVWCCDDDPEIKGLSEGVKNQMLGTFLQIKCSPNWGYAEEKRRVLGIDDNAILVFWVWIKEVDPYLDHEPKCCTIL
eukprot:74794_1